MPLYEKIFDIEYQLPELDTLVVHYFISFALIGQYLTLGFPQVHDFDARYCFYIRANLTSCSLIIYVKGLIAGRTSAFLLDPQWVDMHG
jgi:hypothetical protein